MKKLFSLILLLSFTIKAQSQIIFDNVRHKKIITKEDFSSDNDSLASESIVNFGHLSKAKVEELGNYLKVLFKYKNSNEGYNLYDYEGNTPVKPEDLIKQLVNIGDTITTSRFYDTLYPDPQLIGKGFLQWDPYDVRMAEYTDSTWFFRNLSGFRFTEDWIIDTVKFTCDIKSKSYAPLIFEGEGYHTAFYQITPKPTLEKQTFNFITDFIITDIYIDDDDESNVMRSVDKFNYMRNDEMTNLDTYKTLMLINFIIDKAKLGKIACFNPIIPFNTQLTTAELKSLLTEDVSFNKDDNFQVRNKLYSYSFKMVEKWAFDSKSLAFKKVALGIVLMKIKKKTVVNPYNINYEFIPVFYTPFNKK